MVQMVKLDNRDEWLKNRNKYIGGSDAACILGLNPWKTNVQLWEEKTGSVIPKDISDNPNVRYGTLAEEHIRNLFQLTYEKYDVHYIDNNSWINSDYPWAAVSHDGWLTEKETGRKGIWECKTTEVVSSMQKEKWKDRIPDNYYCQILHSFLVRSDCEFAHLTALLTWRYTDSEVYQQIKNYHIERSDCLEDIEYLAEAERGFWEAIKEGRKPDLILPGI